MQAAANARGIRLRPHSKTHKSPLIAHWQIERGAVGICCAKLGEAEVFADAGHRGHPAPLSAQSRRMPIAWSRCSTARSLSFIVDHPVVAKQWSDAMMRGGQAGRRAGQGRRRLPSLRHRSRRARGAADDRGVASLAGAAASRACCRTPARPITRIPKTGCGGWPRPRRGRCATWRSAAGKDGVPIDEVSAGATPPARFSLQQDGLHRVPTRQLRLLRSHAGRARRARRSTTAR